MSQEQIDRIAIHTETFIKGFFGEYRWLSNYHICPIFYEGIEYTSSEAAYQSAKTTDEYARSLFSKMTPSQSRKFGQEIKPRKDWDDIKIDVMYTVLKDKFTRNQDLKEKLLQTGNKILEETNWWNDTFWGVCDGKGKSHLGNVIMKIRKEINDEAR